MKRKTGLLDTELSSVEFQHRMFILRRMLDIPEIRWQCFVLLSRSKKPISEISLSYLLHSPRSTIRKHLELPIQHSVILRSEAGLYPSESGLQLMRDGIRNASLIALGIQIGFPESCLTYALSHVAEPARSERLKALRVVSFSPRLKDLNEIF